MKKKNNSVVTLTTEEYSLKLRRNSRESVPMNTPNHHSFVTMTKEAP